MINIGIMGGTFNPIHIGHIISAQEVLEKRKMHKILFIPSSDPPHKSEDVVDAIDRYNMVKIAIEDNPKFDISDIEIRREGKTYTYDTLIELNQIYKNCNLFFIIGYDTLATIDTWKRVDDVFKLCRFIVVNRENDIDEMNREIAIKKAKYGACIDLVDIPDVKISSTEIRRRIAFGETVKYLIPEKVEEYINIRGLYKSNGYEKL